MVDWSDDAYRVNAKCFLGLEQISADRPADVPKAKDERQKQVKEMSMMLNHLQTLLFAQKKYALLIILQGMDTAGKDSSIRRIFKYVHPLGVRVQSFKQPSTLELAHDYLWRVHAVTPMRGEIAIFNRSHYEDVLVGRVHGLIDDDLQQQRYGHINDFERMLSDNGTVILKFFLHISKDEQRQRLQERVDNPEKHWKFAVGDLRDRALWDRFQAVYSDVLVNTSTSYAPWYVIPANSKTSRDMLILKILLRHVHALDLAFPHMDTRDWPKVIE